MRRQDQLQSTHHHSSDWTPAPRLCNARVEEQPHFFLLLAVHRLHAGLHWAPSGREDSDWTSLGTLAHARCDAAPGMPVGGCAASKPVLQEPGIWPNTGEPLGKPQSHDALALGRLLAVVAGSRPRRSNEQNLYGSWPRWAPVEGWYHCTCGGRVVTFLLTRTDVCKGHFCLRAPMYSLRSTWARRPNLDAGPPLAPPSESWLLIPGTFDLAFRTTRYLLLLASWQNKL